jgi:hypothetical protein
MLKGPAPEFNRVSWAMFKVMRDAKEAAELLHPIYGYDFKTLPEAEAEDLADKLEECARFLRMKVADVAEKRKARMTA